MTLKNVSKSSVFQTGSKVLHSVNWKNGETCNPRDASLVVYVGCGDSRAGDLLCCREGVTPDPDYTYYIEVVGTSRAGDLFGCGEGDDP